MNAQLLNGCLWAAFLSFFLLSCQSSGEDAAAASQKDRKPFFDMRDYFTQQIARLQKLQPTVRKTVTFDDQTETQTLDSLDYERELEVFLNADINRAAWWDRYRIDSSFTDQNQLDAVWYSASNEELRIRSLKVKYKDGKVAQLEVESEDRSPAAGRRRKLFFDPQWGYRIESRQNVAFSKAREIKIEVRFAKE